MRIKELMGLEFFRDSKLLTGDVGVENQIDSVMVLEAMDIEKWSKKNQLILTSYYAFEGKSDAEIEEFIQKMELLGLSGLIIKVDRLIKMIPNEIIALCTKHHVPLIKVTQNVSYEKIMLAIFQPILNHQSHVLKTYYEVRQKFSKLTRNFSSFEKIMSEFHRLIQKPCVLTIPTQNILISIDILDDQLVVLNKSELPNQEFTRNHYEQLQLYSQKNAQETTAIRTHILNNYAEDCTLTVYQEDCSISETDMMIIENIIDVLQEKLQMEYLIKRDRYTRMNNLADAILQNTPQNPDELESLLQEANMSGYAFYQGIAFSTDDLDTRLIRKEIRNSLRTLKERVLFFEHHNYLMVLYNFEEEWEQLHKNDISSRFSNYFDMYPNLTFVISSIKTKNDLKEILLECLDTIRFNHEYFIDNVVDIKDLGIFRYFLKDDRVAEVGTLISQQLIDLKLDQPDLFETLYVFFHTNRNYKKTAETLFLHSKTVRYRLDKIQERLGIDLSNPIQAMNFELGTYLLKLKVKGNMYEKKY